MGFTGREILDSFPAYHRRDGLDDLQTYRLTKEDQAEFAEKLIALDTEIALGVSINLREKPSTGSAKAESGFTPEGAIGKTVGLSYEPEAQ